MFDLELEFTRLTEEFDIPMENLEEQLQYQRYMDEFQAVWESLPDDQPVAFYGFAYGTVAMYKRIPKLTPKRLVCVIDRSARAPDSGSFVPVVPIEGAGAYRIQHIILSAFASRQEMKAQARTYLPEATVYDLYERLEAKGMRYDGVFYHTYPDVWCLRLQRMRAALASAHDPAARRDALAELIGGYLCVRDFVYARHYAQLYLQSGYADAPKYAAFFSRLDDLFDRARQGIRQSTRRNIVMICLDSVSEATLAHMPFLQRYGAQGVTFTNAYSASSHTRAALFSCLTQREYLTGDLFAKSHLSPGESPLLEALKARNYKFKALSPNIEKYWMMGNLNEYEGEFISIGAQSYLMWLCVCEMLRQEQNALFFIHVLETHPEFICAYSQQPLLYCRSAVESGDYTQWEGLTGDNLEKLKQVCRRELQMIETAAAYTDRQMEFYLDFFDVSRDTVLLFGDHKTGLIWDSPLIPLEEFQEQKENYEKIALILRTPELQPTLMRHLYCLNGIGGILHALVTQSRPLEVCGMEWARYETEPFYGNTLVKIHAFEAQGNAIPYQHDFSGMIRLRGAQEVYTQYLDGHQCYTRGASPENLADCPQWAQRVAYIREMIQADIPGIWKKLFELYPHIRSYFWEHILPEYRPAE